MYLSIILDVSFSAKINDKYFCFILLSLYIFIKLLQNFIAYKFLLLFWIIIIYLLRLWVVLLILT